MSAVDLSVDAVYSRSVNCRRFVEDRLCLAYTRAGNWISGHQSVAVHWSADDGAGVGLVVRDRTIRAVLD